MAITVTTFRVTAIWVQSFVDLLEGTHSDGPLARLGQQSEFASQFDAAQAALKSRRWDKEPVPSLHVPWGSPYSRSFWTHYTGKNPGGVTGYEAWKQSIPMRLKLQYSARAPWFSGTAYNEAHVYPHGVAFSVTATGKAGGHPSTLADVHKAALGIVHEGEFSVAEGTSTSQLKAPALATRAMVALMRDLLGGTSPTGERSSEPITVLTIIAAEGADADQPPQPNSEVHRFLDATTAWSPTLSHATPQDISKAAIDISEKRAGSGSILYGTQRGRAVWFPASFRTGANPSRLSCYHRNLVTGSMQAEALGLHIVSSLRWVADHGSIDSEPHRQSLQRAAYLLGNLLMGAGQGASPDGEMFRSGSVKRLIQDAYLEPLKRARDLLGIVAVS